MQCAARLQEWHAMPELRTLMRNFFKDEAGASSVTVERLQLDVADERLRSIFADVTARNSTAGRRAVCVRNEPQLLSRDVEQAVRHVFASRRKGGDANNDDDPARSNHESRATDAVFLLQRVPQSQPDVLLTAGQSTGGAADQTEVLVFFEVRCRFFRAGAAAEWRQTLRDTAFHGLQELEARIVDELKDEEPDDEQSDGKTHERDKLQRPVGAAVTLLDDGANTRQHVSLACITLLSAPPACTDDGKHKQCLPPCRKNTYAAELSSWEAGDEEEREPEQQEDRAVLERLTLVCMLLAHGCSGAAHATAALEEHPRMSSDDRATLAAVTVASPWADAQPDTKQSRAKALQSRV
jgi:hypothetical protein